MTKLKHEVAVPAAALIHPTLMLTGRSAAAVYAQPAAQLRRLANAGVIIKIAHGYYVAIPVDKRKGDCHHLKPSLLGWPPRSMAKAMAHYGAFPPLACMGPCLEL